MLPFIMQRVADCALFKLAFAPRTTLAITLPCVCVCVCYDVSQFVFLKKKKIT